MVNSRADFLERLAVSGENIFTERHHEPFDHFVEHVLGDLVSSDQLRRWTWISPGAVRIVVCTAVYRV